MVRIINLDGVSLAKNGKVVLNNLSFSVEKGSFVSIIGGNGSGKSSLINVLSGVEDYNGYININGYSLDEDNIGEIRKNVSVLLSGMDSQFIQETVMDELVFSLENLGWDKELIKKRLDEIVKIFDMRNILNVSPWELNNSQRQKLLIACALISSPDILIIDGCMHQLSVRDKAFIFDILNGYKKNKKLTVIMSLNNIEDAVNFDRVVVLDKGKIVMDGSTISVLKNKSKLYELGVGLPFVMDFSLRLMDKGIVNHVYLDIRKLVDDIWR